MSYDLSERITPVLSPADQARIDEVLPAITNMHKLRRVLASIRPEHRRRIFEEIAPRLPFKASWLLAQPRRMHA